MPNKTPKSPVKKKKKKTSAPSSTTETKKVVKDVPHGAAPIEEVTKGTPVYFDATKGPVVDTDALKKSYAFNPPLLLSADRGTLPDSMFPAVERGYLIQDPDVVISDSVSGLDQSGTNMVEYLRLTQTNKKYGFRFLYNPAQVSMGVGYSPGVDIMTLANNMDSMYNPIVPQTGSTVVFELLLNRVEDLAAGDDLKKDMYPEGSITDEQIKAIKSMGTMADYEYLLLALNTGKKLKSKYRGTTADVGWLLGGAVVLRLGKSLVYQGFIENVSINHTRFTPTMIPSISSVQISMARYVDLVPESRGSRETTGSSPVPYNGMLY